jgi:hypothetical protein
MARPHPTAKPSVNLASNLASSGPRVSRIRRDPPPAVKAEVVVDAEEREQWSVVVGILAFALAIFVIIIAFGSYSGWSPSQYTVRVDCGASGSDC